MNIVDLFAGGGGASEGIRQALGVPPAVAINHDARIGNSVCPPVARAVVSAQFGSEPSEMAA